MSERTRVQRKKDADLDAVPQLGQDTRALTEPRFGFDLGQVQIQHSAPAPLLQPKLTISQPGDPYEQEADRVADAVVNGGYAFVDSPSTTPSVQRDAADSPPPQSSGQLPPDAEFPPSDSGPSASEEMAEGLEAIGKAIQKTPAGKELKRKAEELGAELWSHLEGKVVVIVSGAAALGTLFAANRELPAAIPDIPLDWAVPGLKANLTYEGPLRKPTKVMLTLTLSFGGGGSDTGATSRQTSDPQAEEIRRFQQSIHYTPGTPEAREEAARQAADEQRAVSRALNPALGDFTRLGSPSAFGWHSENAEASQPNPFQLTPPTFGEDLGRPRLPRLVPELRLDEPFIMRKASGSTEAMAAPSVVQEVLQSGGQPLDDTTRAFMEPRFGRDFGHVRIHTDSTAARSAEAVSAHAYTVGSDVVFGAGQYRPGTDNGKRLIAHELTHVVQQAVTPLNIQRMPAVAQLAGHAPSKPPMLPPLVNTLTPRHHTLNSPVASLDHLVSTLSRETNPKIGSVQADARPQLQQRSTLFAEHWRQLDIGEPIEPEVRAAYQHSYGKDLSHVRVHTDSSAAALTRELQTPAFTVANHIVFRPGVYSRSTGGDRHILGHELAHVLQQSRSRPSGATLRLSTPTSPAEWEAEQAATTALAGQQTGISVSSTTDLMGIPPVALIALLGLAVGALLAIGAEVAGPSYEENSRSAQEPDALINQTGWMLVPVFGTAVKILDARNPLERYFNVLLMPLDFVTLNTAGSALLKLSAFGRAAFQDVASSEAEQIAQSGIRSVTRAEINAHAARALDQGYAVAASLSWRNHAVIWVKVGNQYYRLTGGALRSMAVREGITEFVPKGSLNAISIIRQPGINQLLLDEARRMEATALFSRSFGGVGYTARSCSISQSVLLERAGLGHLVPATRAGQFLPVAVMGRLSETTGVMATNLGAWKIIGGTVGVQMPLAGTVYYGLPHSVVDVASGHPESSPVWPLSNLLNGPHPLQAINESFDNPESLESVPIDMLPQIGAQLDVQGAQNAIAGNMRQDQTDAQKPSLITPVFIYLGTNDESVANTDQVLDIANLHLLNGPINHQTEEAVTQDMSQQTHEGALQIAYALASARSERDHIQVIRNVSQHFPFAIATPARWQQVRDALHDEGIDNDTIELILQQLYAAQH